MPAQKKSKRKEQHKKAIEGYEKWERENPKATHKQKFDAFDSMVDSSELEEVFRRARSS